MKILQMISSVAIATSIATVAAIVSPVTANAATFTFDNIAGGDPVGDPLNVFLSMDVTDSGTGGVLFKFNNAANNTATTSFIRSVFIDGSTALLGDSITVNKDNVGTVEFERGSNSQQLPQGGNGFTTDYSFDRITGRGSNDKGIEPTESLGVSFAGANFNNVISAINGGSLRVGYHLQGLPDGKSDSYINAKPVPVPGFVLGVMAAGALGSTRLLKKKQAA